jgi:DNA-binding transcriptional ArsR family regulator
MLPLSHPRREDIALPDVLQALSDPHRLRIVSRLAESDELCPCGSFDLELSKSTLTHHFRVLREAGVIHQEQAGTSKLNALRRDDLDARFPGLLDSVLAASGTRVPSGAR